MTENIVVNVNLEISAASLQTIVATVKQLAGRDDKGFFRVDTANAVSDMISKFLREKDFESYVKDIDNY